MNSVFKHVVQKVRIRLNKLIQSLKLLNLSTLLIIEEVEINLIRVKLLILHLNLKVLLLLTNLTIPLFQLLFLLLQTPYLFINLLLHHLVKILLLNIKLLHDATERLFKSIDFFIKLFADFKLKLIIVLFFTGWGFRLNLFNFKQKFLNHSFHTHDLW